MTAVLLALAAATSWGASDFLGGFASRRSVEDRSLAISLWSSIAGLPGIAVVAVLAGGDPTGEDLLLGALGGVGGGFGILALYRGLAIGTMGVVAPVTGAVGAAIPVALGAVTGERPSLTQWIGILAALVAIALVSREEDVKRSEVRGIGLAVAAGVGFGVFFVFLDATSNGSGLWPLIPVKVAASLALVAVGTATRRPLAPPPRTLVLLAGIAVLDAAANGTYLLATREGLLAVVAVVSSLYPVGTVLLARVVLSERLVRHQVAGLGLALASIALVASG